MLSDIYGEIPVVAAMWFFEEAKNPVAFIEPTFGINRSIPNETFAITVGEAPFLPQPGVPGKELLKFVQRWFLGCHVSGVKLETSLPTNRRDSWMAVGGAAGAGFSSYRS